MNKPMKLIIPLVALCVVVAGCTSMPGGSTPTAQQKDQAITESYQQKLTAKVPYPLEQMNDSLERRNQREKLLRFNKPDKIGYVYFMSQTGEVIAFFTVKGKVSSTQSQMTTTDVISKGGCQTNVGCEGMVTTPAASDDGSYGPNEDGIFFFTTEDVYVNWSGLYVYMDAPLKVDSVTHRVGGLEDGAKPTSVGESAESRQK